MTRRTFSTGQRKNASISPSALRGSKSAGEIADAFELTRPTLSHHFRILRAAGLVRSERRGTSIVYTLQTNVLEDLATEIYEIAALPNPKRVKT